LAQAPGPLPRDLPDSLGPSRGLRRGCYPKPGLGEPGPDRPLAIVNPLQPQRRRIETMPHGNELFRRKRLQPFLLGKFVSPPPRLFLTRLFSQLTVSFAVVQVAI